MTESPVAAGAARAAEPPVTFADLLRERRRRARFTQQELADAAGISLRTVSDLERAVATTPQRETLRLLAGALHLSGPDLAQFEAVGRGHPVARESLVAAATTMRALPRDAASFTGRQRELDQLLKSAETTGGVLGIHAIGGMAGVGKTTLAVHAAHQMAGRFPDGQVFLPLHGHTPGRLPVDPADALASLLLTAGVSAQAIPPDLESRAALWRNRVAGQRLLLVLDDAADSDQVQPLLPGGGGSLVLVTSRRHLTALDDLTAISLDTLPPAEAAELLVRLAGRAALGPTEPGVAELTSLCGFLPLAVGLLARQLRHHPAWTVAGRVGELAAARDRLELMQTENLSVAAAFDLSYVTLSGGQQRLFRRLGLHPGADTDRYAAAALDGLSLPAARRGLEDLYDRHLLTEPVQGRYRMHNLLRDHARTLAGRLDADEDREAAIDRLMDYYQQTATVADARIRGVTLVQATENGAPAEAPDLADEDQGLAWCRTERANLVACLDYASADGQLMRVAVLTAGLFGLFWRDGPWDESGSRRLAAAVRAAEQLGDPLILANALLDLGVVRQWAGGDYLAAVQDHRRALSLVRDLGDPRAQARALYVLGAALSLATDFADAIQALDEALGLYRDLGDERGQASVLFFLGQARHLTDDSQGAARALEESCRLYRELGERTGEGQALISLALAWRLIGDFPAAIQALEQALGLTRDRDWLSLANTLAELGKTRILLGEYPAAERALRKALSAYQENGELLGQVSALISLGALRRLTGDVTAAAAALDRALVLTGDVGNRYGKAAALNERGTLHQLRGELAAARECHQRSLDLAREIGSPWNEAHALAGLGRCNLAAGQSAQAGELLRQALDVFRRIGAHETRGVQAELDALAGPPPR
jgi:tetratricopeptide (TPR) repeat protein/transcriptional regulator with XRE-family HTH domain